ncbi:MAG: methyltransferase domain-containing protein [Gammaproteobacteria bacterium]|nr:methyltransferase domain-containing protein [Gammaproteobacteria bacterium]
MTANLHVYADREDLAVLFKQYRPGIDELAFGVEPAKVKYRLRLARYPALMESLERWLAGKTPGQSFDLLDIGAGFGRTFIYMEAAGLKDRFRLRGVDINPLRKEHLFGTDRWIIHQGDAEQGLGFINSADSSFDVVICEQLLEHLHDPAGVVEEAARVLRPGGIFVVGVPIFLEPLAKLRRWRVGRYGLGGSDHVQTYSLKSIRRQLLEHFRIDEQRGFRIISGGVLRSLENRFWWYRFNRWLGERLPAYCIEVQLIARHKYEYSPANRKRETPGVS